MTSLRAVDEPLSATVSLATPIDPVALHTSEISPLEPENKYLFANARRAKRKQGTSIRSGASVPQRFRNQHQVIIYYDSNVQDSLEALVKDIGTARNNLRKGKQARELERGLSLPALSMSNFGRRRRGPGQPTPPKSTPSTEITIEPKSPLNQTPPDEDSCFDDVTKDLESAQALCETAAHQFLRDGDCILEIDRIRSSLNNAMKISDAQVELLGREKDAKAATSNDSLAADEQPLVKPQNLDIAATVVAKINPSITPVTQNLASIEMEADSDNDDDQPELVFDISKFRTARGHGLRA